MKQQNRFTNGKQDYITLSELLEKIDNVELKKEIIYNINVLDRV